MALELLQKLDQISPESLSMYTNEELVALAQEYLELQAFDKNVNFLRYYRPVSAKALEVHKCTAKTIGIGGWEW